MDSNQLNNYQNQDEETIDIKKYLYLILNHWWLFAITLFISLTIAYLINRYSQEEFRVNCSILVGEPDSRIGSTESILDELARAKGKKRKAVVENEISILKSYSMARKTIEELDFSIDYVSVGRRGIVENHLYKSSPFYVVLDTLKNNRKGYPVKIKIISLDEYDLILGEPYNTEKRIRFGEHFISKDFNFTIYFRNQENFDQDRWATRSVYFKILDINSLAKRYQGRLSVEVNAEKGSILTLAMKGFVRQQIADYLNKLSEVYVSSNLNEKNIASENTIKFIDEQLGGITKSLDVTGERLQNFRSKNKVVNLSQEGSFLYEELQSMLGQKAILDINSRYYNYLLTYIEERKDFSDVIAPSVVGVQDELLNDLVAQLNALNLERRNLSLSVVENSPQIKIINNQILNTRDALKENLNSLIEGNNISMDELDARISKSEIKIKKLPSTERQMMKIERDFSINDQIYTFLLEKRAEAGIDKASNTSDHKILDVAMPENSFKTKPNSSMNYMVALAAGGGLPLIILILIDFFNVKISDRKILEKSLKVPIIGTVGHNETKTELPVNENPSSSLAESFRALRTNLQFVLPDDGQKVIAISSAVSGEGKTFTSANLATILAMVGKKVLLVNLDLRKPKLHKIFNLENKMGISNYLVNKCSFSELIKETNINNLYVTTSGPIPPNPSELLSSSQMTLFLKEARSNFDYVLLDTPPIALVTDTITLKPHIDAFIFIIRHNYSKKQVVELVNNIKKEKFNSNIGVVVNDILVRGYYGYNYKYGYGYSYGNKNSYYEEDNSDKGLLARMKSFFK